MYDVIIIGGGAAGLTAAIYTTRRKLSTLLISVDIGGQTNLTQHIENYPGYTELSGPRLMQIFEEQAKSFGTEIIFGKAAKVEKNSETFKVMLSNDEVYESRTVIVTSGKVPRELGIPGEKKFIGRGVSTCATCLPPEETVIANSSAKEISNLQAGDKVLTDDGTFQPVVKTTERNYEGEMIEIKTRFFTEPVSLTGNHPALKMSVQKGRGRKYFNFTFSKPEWVEARNLKKGDLLLYPITKETKDVDSILISDILDNVEVDSHDFVKNKHETFSAKRIKNKIEVDSDFTRLVGYYLSEGCITSRGVNFYFSKKETAYIDDVKNLIHTAFGILPTIKIENNVCRIMTFSKILRDFFESLFGKYAHNKKLPHWVILLPAEKQTELIKGIWRGDGCKRTKDFCIVTNSRNLTYQLRDIFLRLDIVPSIQKRSLEKLKPTTIEGRKIEFRHDKYHITIGGPSLQRMSDILDIQHEKIAKRKRTNRQAFLRDGCALLPIREISTRRYNGKVYNIAVNKNSTYVAKNFIVHNCDAPLFPGKDVAIAGGGNSALDAAEYLSKIAKKVYLVHRRSEFRGEAVLIERVKNASNVEIIFNSVPVEILGDKFVSGLVIENVETKEKRELAVNGLFIEIGYIADTTAVKNLVTLTKQGEILVNEFCETGTHGLFAAGDITNVPFKQTVISAGQGAIAGLQAYTYLQKLAGKTPIKADWGV